MIGIVVGAAVAVGAWLLFFRSHGVGDDLARESSRRSIAGEVRRRQDAGTGGRDVLLGLSESDVAAGLAVGAAGAALGGAAAGAFAGPVGAGIGFAVGVFAAEVAAAIASESYGDIVRAALKKWLRDEDMSAGDANVDALLLREAILGARHLYRHEDGRIAMQWLVVDGEGIGSLYTGRRRDAPAKLIPGMARAQMQQQIQLDAPGQLDGPGRRRLRREWKERAYEGALYVIHARADAPTSWRTPGYVHPKGNWPVVADEPTRLTADWTRVVPDENNVDELCAWYDRARGADWTRT